MAYQINRLDRPFIPGEIIADGNTSVVVVSVSEAFYGTNGFDAGLDQESGSVFSAQVEPVGHPRVVLSTALGFAGQTLRFDEIPFPASLAGMISYVGHPATRALVEALGATTDATGPNGNPGKFSGLAVGESYLAVPLASNPRAEGWTANVAIESIQDLKAILVTRIA